MDFYILLSFCFVFVHCIWYHVVFIKCVTIAIAFEWFTKQKMKKKNIKWILEREDREKLMESQNNWNYSETTLFLSAYIVLKLHFAKQRKENKNEFYHPQLQRKLISYVFLYTTNFIFFLLFFLFYPLISIAVV